jgi:high-affinity nickel-transport protein
MESLPTSLPTHWLSLSAVVLLLGLKHGLDPDHIAAIDGLTRFNAVNRPRLSRWAGLLFSAGHGMVVTAVALTVATVAAGWQAPGWLEDAGTLISIAVLTLLGVANLSAVVRAPRGESIQPVGLRGRLFGRLVRAEHPVLVAAVGAAFALSFDTISQAVLFSVTGASLAGWMFAATLGLVFTAGMMATDALNGWWVSRMLERSSAQRAVASRVMGAAIGSAALAIAATGAWRYVSPLRDQAEPWGMALGIALMGAIAAAYALSQVLNFRSA